MVIQRANHCLKAELRTTDPGPYMGARLPHSPKASAGQVDASPAPIECRLSLAQGGEVDRLAAGEAGGFGGEGDEVAFEPVFGEGLVELVIE